jgi:predicted RNA binding protein YcfA (HicA-like mRNA interferase family)
MKRIDFIRHLEAQGCEFLRDGSKHTVYVNRQTQKTSTVPRHREINDLLVRKICKDFQVDAP